MSAPLEDLHKQNRQMIEQLRSGQLVGAPLLVLHTIGARSGQERLNPLMYHDLGDGSVAIFASANGAPNDPDWYRNLVMRPTVVAEIDTQTRRFRARTASGKERESIWSIHKRRNPVFASFEAKTDRQIPVVILEPL